MNGVKDFGPPNRILDGSVIFKIGVGVTFSVTLVKFREDFGQVKGCVNTPRSCILSATVINRSSIGAGNTAIGVATGGKIKEVFE